MSAKEFWKRERKRTGCVKAIQKGLTEFPDSETQLPAIRSIARREQLYSGAYIGDAPDLLVNFRPGFRVSWQSALGGFANRLIKDNTRRWSGDHIVDPESVPGILFMNQPARHNHAQIIDLAPTILNYLGVSAPESMEGKSLL